MILLDTHVWLWSLLDSRRLSERARAAIAAAARDGRLHVSVVSVWEVGILEVKGRVSLRLPCAEWVRRALALPGVRLVGLTPEIAIDSSRLPGTFHKDPADQILTATARLENLTLLTRDQRILDYAGQGHVSAAPA